MNTDNRTDDELNKIIAEWCGWRFIPSQDSYIAGIDQALPEHWEDPDEAAHEQCPNYCRDLNAVHEAEKKLDPSLLRDYGVQLLDNSIDKKTGERRYRVYYATARQRAEALVRVIETTAPSA